MSSKQLPDLKTAIREIEEVLVPFYQDRFDRLGLEESGLYELYAEPIGRGRIFGNADADRLGLILDYIKPFDRYVLYKAGLGELGFALARAGRNVIAWERNVHRRKAITEATDALAAKYPEIGERFTLAGAGLESIDLKSGGKSLGVGFNLTLPVSSKAEEAGLARRFAETDGLLYVPRLFLRKREPATADTEANTLLAAAGFKSFEALPLSGAWLAVRGRGKPTNAPKKARPRKSPFPKGAATGLFTITGSSYSGSTILNTLLGSHPQVAGGGELHWLTTHTADGVCALCGVNCAVWTPEVREAITHANLYDATASVFGRPFVCDASKKPHWFDTLLPLYEGVPRTNILIVKHPVRHVSSFLHRATIKPNMEAYRDPQYVLAHLASYYRRAEEVMSLDLRIRYEDLVTDMPAVITRILSHQDLDYVDTIGDWQSLEHHHIGGNAGPRNQLARQIKPKGEHLRRKYDRDGLFLDNSYLEVLNERTFRQISDSPETREICERFGYEPLEFRATATA